MNIRNRIPSIVSILVLVVLLPGPATADDAAVGVTHPAATPDPACAQDVKDLRVWLYSMAAGSERRLSDDPLDAQLLEPALRPLAEQLATECAGVGWALTRVGSARSRDKVLWLAEYVPAAVERCACDVDQVTLSHLLYQVSASPRLAGRTVEREESRANGQVDRDTAIPHDVLRPERAPRAAAER